MTVILPTVHPRQLIRAAFVTALTEVVTLAGTNVFPNRLEFYDLSQLTPPFIGVYCLDERVVAPLTSPPVYRRAMSVFLDCWQTPQGETAVQSELDLLAAQVEAVIHGGRNRIRELAAVQWRQPPSYESTEISLMTVEGDIVFASQTLEFSVKYEWTPETDITGLDLFKTLSNGWKLPPSGSPKLYTRITLHKEDA